MGGAFTATDPATDEVVATVTVEAATVDEDCTAKGSTSAENGHLVGLKVSVTPGPAAPGDLTVNATSFAFTAADGTSAGSAATTAARTCLTDADAFPAGPLTAGKKYTGVVVLDVPGTTGTATYRPAADAAGGRWSF
jgi:hypothetical protein